MSLIFKNKQAYWKEFRERNVLLYENNYLVNLENTHQLIYSNQQVNCEKTFEGGVTPKTHKLDQGLIGISLFLDMVFFDDNYVLKISDIAEDTENIAVVCHEVMGK